MKKEWVLGVFALGIFLFISLISAEYTEVTDFSPVDPCNDSIDNISFMVASSDYCKTFFGLSGLMWCDTNIFWDACTFCGCDSARDNKVICCTRDLIQETPETYAICRKDSYVFSKYNLLTQGGEIDCSSELLPCRQTDCTYTDECSISGTKISGVTCDGDCPMRNVDGLICNSKMGRCNSTGSCVGSVFHEGINVMPVISSPENGRTYGEGLVFFNATQSFVANCTTGIMVNRDFITDDRLFNCSYLHSPGQKNTTGYTLTANWTLDDDGGDAFRVGLWNVTNSDGRGYSDFWYLYRSGGVHYIKLRLTYED